VNAEKALIEQFPYEIHQVRGPGGDLVWVQRGINPDDIFNDKRKTEWPFSILLADMICQRVAEGDSLLRICREPGYPPYAVVCKWKRANSEFNELLEMAYKDSVEFYIDRVLELASQVESKADVPVLRLKIDAFKWCVGGKTGPKKAVIQHNNFSLIVVD